MRCAPVTAGLVANANLDATSNVASIRFTHRKGDYIAPGNTFVSECCGLPQNLMCFGGRDVAAE